MPKGPLCDGHVFPLLHLFQLLLAYPEEEPSTASWKAALSRALARPVPASQICQLLCSTKESFPSLQPVMQELQLAGEKLLLSIARQ